MIIIRKYAYHWRIDKRHQIWVCLNDVLFVVWRWKVGLLNWPSSFDNFYLNSNISFHC